MMKKILIFQRVLTKYRYELLKELSENSAIEKISIIAAKGMKFGAQKTCRQAKNTDKVEVNIVKSFNFLFRGKHRDTFVPFYPQMFFQIFKYDILLLEGTTNFFNNIWIIPCAKVFRKKTIWWDSGATFINRSRSRKLKDFIISLLIRFTDIQMSYSTSGGEYMKKYMGARNCFINVNTISTRYFRNRIIMNKSIHSQDKLSLLYVGAIEKRKQLDTFIKMLSKENFSKQIYFTIIGNGAYAEELKKISHAPHIKLVFVDPIYEFSELESYYLAADLFVQPGEGGLSIIQALQFGVPVTTVPADGTEADYIISGQNGFLCKDLEEMIQSISLFDKLSICEINKIQHSIHSNNLKINSASWIATFINHIMPSCPVTH